VIGAFPESRFVIGVVFDAIGTKAPKPFSVDTVNQMRFGKFPTGKCFIK
jgi:hypothetical protein